MRGGFSSKGKSRASSGAGHFAGTLPSVLCPPFGAKAAGRTGTAAVSPIVPDGALTEVATVGRLQNEVDEDGAAERFREAPGRRFVSPHQWRFQHKSCVHAEVHGELHGFDRVVAAIRIAGKIRFAHAADNVLQAAPVGERCRECQKDKVAARHECIGEAATVGHYLNVVGHRRFGNLRQGLDADHVVIAKTIAPSGKIAA